MLWLLLSVLISHALPAAIDRNQAYQYAEEAYRAGYPLVLQELIRQTLTEADQKIPMGQLFHERAFPSPMKPEIRWTNLDTLYTLGFADLTKDPYILTVPQFEERLFLFGIMSAWNEEVFAIRKAGTYALVGPAWKGTIPKGMKIIKSPTNNIFIVGKIFSTGTEDDFERVHTLQDAIALRPLSFSDDDHVYTIDNFDEKNVDEIQKTLGSIAYFQLIAESLKRNPPPSDQIAKILSRVGINAGSRTISPNLDPLVVEAMRNVPKELSKKVGLPENKIESLGGWTYSLNEGALGADYMRRTLSQDLGKAFPHETVYLYTERDETNKPFDGQHRYILHISKEKLPPVKGTWSLTAYDSAGRLFENPLGRYVIKDGNSIVYNPDGSLDLYLQNRYPGKRKEDNWLPVPEGRFSLMLRLYLPEKEIYEKNWIMPGVKKEDF